jgi:hypothetical protein
MTPSMDLAIWPPDWSQFFPDALLTVITGLAIGIALYRFQARAEANAARRRTLAEWAMVRPQIAHALATAPNREFGTIQLEMYTSGIFQKAVDGKPFSTWADDAPEDKELAAVRDLARLHYELREAAYAVDGRLHSYYQLLVTGGAPDNAVKFIRGAILDYTNPADRISDVVPGVDYYQYVENFEAIPGVQIEIDRFRALATEYESSWIRLRERLRESR